MSQRFRAWNVICACVMPSFGYASHLTVEVHLPLPVVFVKVLHQGVVHHPRVVDEDVDWTEGALRVTHHLTHLTASTSRLSLAKYQLSLTKSQLPGIKFQLSISVDNHLLSAVSLISTVNNQIPAVNNQIPAVIFVSSLSVIKSQLSITNHISSISNHMRPVVITPPQPSVTPAVNHQSVAPAVSHRPRLPAPCRWRRTWARSPSPRRARCRPAGRAACPPAAPPSPPAPPPLPGGARSPPRSRLTPPSLWPPCRPMASRLHRTPPERGSS